MIVLHNLHGEPIAINGGLIERVEGETETHVTLTSGTSYIVRESLEEVVAHQREDRAEVQAAAIRRLTAEEPPLARPDGDPALCLVVPITRDERGEQS